MKVFEEIGDCGRIVVFIGPPGCGKGTVSFALVNEYNFSGFSAGEELRKEVASGSKLGGEIETVVNNGGFVSDDVINTMAKNFVENAVSNRLLFDGFPRKVSQAEALTSILKADKKLQVQVCYFEIADSVLEKRILGRFSCKNCGRGYNEFSEPTKKAGVCDFCGEDEFSRRSDDNLEVFSKRLERYKETTLPVLGYYREFMEVDVIDANANVWEVRTQVLEVIGL